MVTDYPRRIDAPYFSVVIPLFNKERLIDRALDSVLAQDFCDFEIIVVNDGSTDRGPVCVELRQDDRIRLVHQQRIGVAGARNRGIEESRASLIAFLDADDEWAPGFLNTIADLVERFPDAGLYGTGYSFVDHRGIIPAGCGPEFRDRDHPEVIRRFFAAASSGVFPVHISSVCVPRRALEAVGRFPEGIHGGEDHATLANLALTYEVVVSERCEARYHVTDTDNNTRFCYSGPAHSFDFWNLLKEHPNHAQYDDLEHWAETKMYDFAMIALVHGGDRRAAEMVLSKITSRHRRRRRLEVRAVLLLPTPVRRILFRIKQYTTTHGMSRSTSDPQAT